MSSVVVIVNYDYYCHCRGHSHGRGDGDGHGFCRFHNDYHYYYLKITKKCDGKQKFCKI